MPMTSPTSWALWGPQFALQRKFDAPAAEGSWHPLVDLPGDTDLLQARFDTTHQALVAMSGGTADPEPRVAASLSQMSLVGRVIALAFAAAVTGWNPSPILAGDLWWQPAPGPAFPVALRGTLAPAASGPGIGPTLVGSWVEAVTEAVSRLADLSPHVTWGNVASVVQATFRTIDRVAPERGEAARVVRSALLAHPSIAPSDRSDAELFIRSSCCLLYRASPDRTPVCGDCLLGAR